MRRPAFFLSFDVGELSGHSPLELDSQKIDPLLSKEAFAIEQLKIVPHPPLQAELLPPSSVCHKASHRWLASIPPAGSLHRWSRSCADWETAHLE